MTIDFSKIDKEKYYFDKDEATRVIKFMETFIKLVDGKKAGQPMLLLDWQKELLVNLFGWKRKSDNTRKFRQVFLFIPRKNGKTVFAAAISLYVLLMDNEEFAQCYFAASDRSQASLAFDVVKALIKKEPKFDKVLKVLLNSIKYEKLNSFLKVISSEASTKHGYNTHYCIIDELHTHPNDELYQVLTTSIGARSQPIVFVITTAGTNKQHICYELYDYSKKLIQGVIEDDSFLPYIFEGDPEKAIDDIENLTLANPSLGHGVSLEYLLNAAQKAKSIPTQYSAYRQLHLNIWEDATTTFIRTVDWIACKSDFKEEELYGEECYMSYDLSSNKDLTSINLLFPPNSNRKHFRTLSYNFLPYDAAVEKQNIAAGKVFLTWAEDPSNNLFLTIGKTTDFNFVLEKIAELNEKFSIKKIVYDRFLSNYMSQEVSKIVECPVVEFNQNFKNFSPATKELESMVLERNLEHNDNKVLTWCISNVRIMQDNHDNIKPIKGKSSDKIDAAISLMMNIGIYLLDLAEPDDNYYDGDGFVMI
jgi:phage terminase large subunit-like protein